MKKNITFLQHNLPYQAGESAHFEEPEAERLVKSGAARYDEPEAVAEEPKEAEGEAESTPSTTSTKSTRKPKAAQE